MTRRLEFTTEDLAEVEDAASATALVDALEAALEELLDAEEERIVAERDFLLEVYDGMTGGAALEATSSLFVDSFLSGALADLGFVG